MRRYDRKRDFFRIYRYLESEHIPPLGMVFDRDVTWVNDHGFFTYRIEHNNTQPWLIHFYIEPQYRSYTTCYRMYQHFKAEMIKRNFHWFVVTVPDDKKYIYKFIRLAGSSTPYARKNNMDFYKVTFKEG